ncbi:MAG: DsbA family protein [Polyangiaceae bacterium]
MTTQTSIVGFLLCFFAGMGFMYSAQRAQQPLTKATSESASPDHSGAAIPIDKDDPQWGRSDAYVTLVEFSDLECTFCKRVEPDLARIRAEYGADKLRFVWKHMPLSFHKQARNAALASQSVMSRKGSEAFWKFRDLAYQNQAGLNPAAFELWAMDLGVSAAEFRTDLGDSKLSSQLRADEALAKRLGVSGTPTFFVNGRRLVGAASFAQLKEVIDAELAEAKRLEAAGTGRGDIYPQRLSVNLVAQPAPTPRPSAPPAPQDTTVYHVPVTPSDFIRGPSDAPVTIVEFSDYECGYCKRVEATLHKLMKDYPGDVRLVWKDRPLSFHRYAQGAAEFARAATKPGSPGSYWQVHDALFEAQPRFAPMELEALAQKLGQPWKSIEARMKSQPVQAAIREDIQLADSLKVSGTPNFFINGRALRGAVPIERFAALIDAELAKAKQLIAAGTPRAAVYSTLMRGARKPD